MGLRKQIQVSDRTAAIASFVLALASLITAIYHMQILVPLLQDGKRAEATVTGFHRGARNTRWAIYRFSADGRTVTARDKFPLYIIRPGKGEQVVVVYDPADANIVTADLGIWIWQGPAIFLFGFVFLGGTGLLILHYRPGQRKKPD